MKRRLTVFSGWLVPLILLTAALHFSAADTWAQATSSATIGGQVTDQQKAAIPGVEIKLLDASTSTTLTATTNESGRYVFVDVPPGTYTVVFARTGFTGYRVANQIVEVGSALTLNATMAVGATSTTVEVSASAAAELQTTSASVGNTISNDALMSLPNLGRDVTTLAVLLPGVTLGGNVAGAVSDQNTFTLDGGNISDDMAGNGNGYTTNFNGLGGTQTGGAPSGVVPTPIESIEEVHVSTFNQTADFNSSIGSQVQMATKRGTNQFHGVGYGYYFATNLGAANSWTNNHTIVNGQATQLASNHRARFGAALGGPLTPKVLGGKTYFFFNYEGSRFPNVANYERSVPTALMRAGVIQVPNSAGVYVPYNLNPFAVTVNGTTYQPAVCSSGQLCDPRGIGLNPVVNQIWQKYMPLPNDPLAGDQYNTQGYLSTIRAPLTQNVYVGRIDHDFGEKNRLMASYRSQRLVNLTTNQVDIGGALPGDTFGQPAAKAPRTQVPSFYATSLTTNISPTITNTVLFNYTRNFWQWGSNNAPAQLAGLGGALEIGGESTSALIPYNINTQSIRQRFWDGQDKLYKDDLTMIKGQHLVQFGGSYQRNFDYHSRTDNGNGINNQIVYQSTSSGIDFSNPGIYPSGVPSNQQSNFATLYSEVLGLVSQPQVAYTRSGSNLTLQPVGSTAYDKSIIPTYNLYASDTWHMKPTFTLTYGLGYAVEMPPYELTGKQVALTDSAGQQLSTADYLAARKAAALAGTVYNPTLGYALVGNVGAGLKYPYKPVYNQLSPRLAAAWNPKMAGDGILGKVFGDGKTVIRAGYGRIYGRLNGVNLVLVPLLGVGLLQPVTCAGASSSGQCLGTNGVTPSTAFRIGTDGMTAPLPAASQTLVQPFYPGVSGASAGDLDTLDPNYKPEVTDNFTFTIQRQVSRNSTIEVGYIGRLIRDELQEVNLDAVPYMTTLGGQTFATAYADLYNAIASLPSNTTASQAAAVIAAQPFFESAMGGATSAYCKAYRNCAAAVAAGNLSLIRNGAVSDIWRALNNAPSWTLGRTMVSGNPIQATSIGMTTSLGFGNYNALYVTYRMRNWHGLTTQSNFTYGRSLGTSPQSQSSSSLTALDPWNMNAMYGPNGFDIKFVYNLAMYYQPDWYKSQKGFMGHVAGGWTISPLFTAQSGAIAGVSYSEGSCTACQAFGESSSSSVTTVTENAVFASPYTGTNSRQTGVTGSNGIGTNNPTGLSMFTDPAAVYAEFRRCVLGYDTSCGGYGNVRTLPTWNLDAQVLKNIGIWKEGKVGAEISIQITNVLNHFQPGSPALSLTSPTTFGRINSQANTPRNMEFGLRIHF